MAGNQVNDQRRMWKYILVGILTLGIYDIIFMWCLMRDLNVVCGPTERDNEDRSPNYIVFVLLSLITLGIYSYIWYYKQGNRMKRAGTVWNTTVVESGKDYVLWSLVGLLLFGVGPLVALYLFIGNMNRLSRAYNEQGGYPNNNGGGGWSGNYTPPSYRPNPPMDDGYSPTITDAIENPPTVGLTYGTIECIQGYYRGQSIRLDPGTVLTMGRSGRSSQLVMTDPDVSRRHCDLRFSPQEHAYYVTDYSSLGTYMNGTIQLPKEVMTRVPVGSKLTLGKGNNVFMLK